MNVSKASVRTLASMNSAHVCMYLLDSIMHSSYAFPTKGVFSVRTSDVGRATSKLSDSRRIWTFRAPPFQPDKKKRGGCRTNFGTNIELSFSCRIFCRSSDLSDERR